MNYIELFGLSGAGKSFFKRELEKKSKNNNQQYKYIILKNFYFSNNQLDLSKIKTILLLLINSNIVNFLKPHMRSQGTIKQNNGLITFKKKKRGIFLRILDLLNLDDHYERILNNQKKRYQINSNKLYDIIKKEIKMLNQKKFLKQKLNRWILENMITIEILKRNQNIYCVVDEGILQRIYIVYSLSNKKNLFINNVNKYLDPYGKIIFINTNLNKIMEVSKKRTKLGEGYIYNDMSEIIRVKKEFSIFKKKIKIHYVSKTINGMPPKGKKLS